MTAHHSRIGRKLKSIIHLGAEAPARSAGGTAWGRTFLALAGLLAAMPAGAAQRLSAAVEGRLPAPRADFTLMVQPVDDASGARVWIIAGTVLPQPANLFGARAVSLEHVNKLLSIEQVLELSDRLNEWAAAPHSLTVFAANGTSIGLAATGAAYDPDKEPVVVLQITLWMDLDEGQGHVHGGNYVALPVDQVQALAAALAAWGKNPIAGAAIYGSPIN